MSSLTPENRSQEATDIATHEGLISGGMTLLPTCGALYIAMQNQTFLARTNWQSRTALAIMPALFVFAWTAEHSLTTKMREIAKETQHNSATVEWAESELQKKRLTNNKGLLQQESKAQEEVMALYQKSVYESGVCIVPGNRLGPHHKIANYINANPIKFLACMAIPSVAWIFYGNTGKQHLTFSIKLLHTRVFGQFATISLLLGVMGFKEFMELNGKFITESEAQARVQEMNQIRERLLQRLAMEKQYALEQQQALDMAHEQDVRDDNVHTKQNQQ